MIFALPKRKQAIFRNSSISFINISSYVKDDLNFLVSNISRYDYARRLVEEEVEIIKQYDPDAIVVDFRVSALAAAAITHKKTYAIFVGESLPYGSHLPNPGFPKPVYAVIRSLFPRVYDFVSRRYLRSLLRIMHEHGISTSFDHWVQSVEYFIPEPSHYFPAVSKDLHLHYVGNLSWNNFDQKLPDWFHTIHPDGKTIYLSFGGTGFDTKKPVQIAKALVNAGYRVIVTTGTLSDPADYPIIPGLYVATYLPGDRLSKMVDLVVCHGGYGTMIDAIQSGIPVVTVPFNPDQIMHSLRMQELGVAKCLMNLNIIDMVHVFTFNWRWIEDKGKQISPEQVQKAVKEVLSNIRDYKENIQKFNAAYPKRDGAAEAANTIESTILS